MDEVFETLTLIQTGKAHHAPIVFVGSEFWGGLVDWIKEQLLGCSYVSAPDLDLFVVEDNPVVALEMQHRLQKLGYQILDIVATGTEAVAVAAQQNPSLILMDIYLEDSMDGIEAAQRIHASCQTPIIYLTGHDDVIGALQHSLPLAVRVHHHGALEAKFLAAGGRRDIV